MKYVDRVLPTNEQNIRDVILDGSARARETAKATMAEVHEAMGMGSL